MKRTARIIMLEVIEDETGTAIRELLENVAPIIPFQLESGEDALELKIAKQRELADEVERMHLHLRQVDILETSERERLAVERAEKQLAEATWQKERREQCAAQRATDLEWLAGFKPYTVCAPARPKVKGQSLLGWLSNNCG